MDGKFFAIGSRRLRVQGVTYGPFAPAVDGQPFPAPERVRDDFDRMRAVGINSLRTYHVPPDWFLALAEEQGLKIFLDVPWSKHLCFLESLQAQRESRDAIRRAAEIGRDYSCVLAYSIGNEIPADVVRWHGPRNVERFLAELQDVAKQTDPHGLVTYASYPPSEYLDLSFLDFTTFNLYLHAPETFHRYLFRLQNIVGDKPLVLGEIGMDTLRHGETEQSDFLAGHARLALLSGLAGMFVFSWTDDWFTGGSQITDWEFGITRADRAPKASYHALREVFKAAPAELLPEAPCVSVVVCSYNGGRTLEQCLRSLLSLNYPAYEIIVVDDGSTDDTQAILAGFPEVQAIHQENRGLSAARNAGFHAANGAIITYTDSDCFADQDWLTQLVAQLLHSGAAAVGGPNLTPEDGWLAACVAASPGQPVHVLESDQVAEHIPGCNMAFRREALAAVNGFDAQYRRAGDDVDVCWRLQQAGYWITFAPGAVVWHHRRQTPRSFLRQQAGYGEAEALLRFKHPDKFNGRGDGKWRGALYGASLGSLRFGEPIIYHGTFGTGLFQTLYQPSPAHWAMLPGTLEWHVAAGVLAAASFVWPWAWLGVVAMLLLSLTVAALQAAQARVSPQHDGLRGRCLITLLSYLQPLVRSWTRYRTRVFAYSPPQAGPSCVAVPREKLPWSGCHSLAYWTENSVERTDLLALVIAHLNEQGWGKTLDSGWSDWDLEIYCHPWTVVRISTSQENHGGGQRVIRVRYRLRPTGYLKVLFVAALLEGVGAAIFQLWPMTAATVALLGCCACVWWRGTCRASIAIGAFDERGRELGLIRCGPSAAGIEVSPNGIAFHASSVGWEASDGK